MGELLSNQVLWTAVLASVVAQLLKLFIYYWVERRWEWERLAETGGMPSSHSATVAALATGVGITEGVGSAFFAIAVVLAIIVMYDATGIRRAAGLHAERLNDLFEEFRAVFAHGPRPEPLKELLGHTYLEVAVGAVLGILFAFLSFTLV
ncbi:divergent PAP2 family protein [Meiothermus ruber]|mgnify:CR=1 FL=1|uniref:Acid phosphatase/vanadium-dependent haloperoxidase related protein n=1 Tax=Meiothermus ruber (strain ATCC 35948 / DSM 1279 / VKM B-1258 / 21) TaxID=504728 RepID=D3PLN0_MEIRD|nr:divergent PAP2 family protein [Meiothermus ruber]GIW32480.1 MAG: membrane protein [Meiothermus sp.]ADD29121.1 acid phosphatase/vanadium-dependent haloperoxidase related protein [Meiothermus ruber DSM 1279]AGK05428.1 acid phosphatase/vanadium-dependent haloperoxidase-like protein [Meiothermus ruber DSM 1279]MCX7801897.1 divergent PAP2 family protein [Meiothermus ruber]GAO76043.1 acid phosphatase/vanadium-dependent haloperoxidase-like protein [Meiothermus ruber H328]